MEGYLYVEVMLIRCGYEEILACLPERPGGETGSAWMRRVRNHVKDGVATCKWDQPSADNMTFAAELLCVELRRYPQMIAWDNERYAAAVLHLPHPDDAELLDQLVANNRKPVETEVIDVPPRDMFISDFLNSLIDETRP